MRVISTGCKQITTSTTSLLLSYTVDQGQVSFTQICIDTIIMIPVHVLRVDRNARNRVREAEGGAGVGILCVKTKRTVNDSFAGCVSVCL